MIGCRVCGEILTGSVGELSKHNAEKHKGEMAKHRKGHSNNEHAVNKWADLAIITKEALI
jgi:hypothetical protein